MAITLGKDGAAPPVGSGIISATYTEECEVIDISNRSNVGSAGAGYRAYAAGFKTKTWEVECHNASGLISSLENNGGGFQVMSITENISVDGPVTFTVTLREM